MIIRTQDRRFQVVQVLRRTNGADYCVCRDPDDPETAPELLGCFRDPALRERMLAELAPQAGNGRFTDLLGLFTQDGALYARFRYTQAPPITWRMEDERLGLRTRLEIGGNLLERMALMNMPEAVQLEVLTPENITVDDALNVRFNYVMATAGGRIQTEPAQVAAQAAQVLEGLCRKELAEESVPELTDYLAALRAGEYEGYVRMYAGFDQVRKALLAREIATGVEPRTWLFRLWKKIKGLARFVRPVLAGLVLLASCLYLVYTLLSPTQPEGTPVIFEKIGTVDVVQDQK